jgi:hypothetical protein
MIIYRKAASLGIGLAVGFCSIAMLSCGGGLDTGSDGTTALPAWVGMRSLGASTTSTTGTGVAVDSSSRVYVAGYTNASLDGQTNGGNQGAFLTAYDASGAKLWTRILSGSAGTSNFNYDVSVDSGGHIIVVGKAGSALAGVTPTGTTDLFVAQYDTSGNLVWLKMLGATGSDAYASGVATSSSGAIFAAGRTEAATLDGQPNSASDAAVLVKYDTSGTKAWTRLLDAGTSTSTETLRVAADSSGNSYVVGDTTGDAGGITKTGVIDGFVAKYDSSGTLLWTRHQGLLSKFTFGTAVAVTSSGGVCVTGNTNGQLDGQTGFGSAGSNYDLYVVCYDSSGTRLWTKLFGKSDVDAKGQAIQSDSSGNLYVSGDTHGALGADPQTGADDAVILKLSSSGELQWVHQLGATGKTSRWQGLALDTSSAAGGNRIFVAGYSTGSIGDITVLGSQDAVLALYAADGTRQ